MEKVVSPEERVKRAEEIYNRRRQENGNNYYKVSRTRTKQEQEMPLGIKQRIAKKMVVQMLVCVIIYVAMYIMYHSDQLFSVNFMEKTQEILTYDISLNTLYNKGAEYFNYISKKYTENSVDENTEEDKSSNTLQDGNEQIEEKIEEQNSLENILDDSENIKLQEQEGIGGSDEVLAPQEESVELQDISYVKNNLSIIWPLVGTITSRYGARTPTEIVSANHYGIDIAGNIGDTIVSAMDGIVAISTEVTSYGKYIKIQNGEITTIYAHCSSLLVSVGQEISQGQKIAEVGQTGYATGPHLHFEIRREDRPINPEEILGTVWGNYADKN